MAPVTYLEAIRQGIWEEMERDPSVFCIGEDIGIYGGAFKVTEGLIDRFGPARVIDTPISEMAIVNASFGAALTGMRPVAEFQFMDFISCAFNQIVNLLAKAHYRWGAPVPVVLRGPSGGGVHGGPFHSQNPETYFAHTPGSESRLSGHRLRRQGPDQVRHSRQQSRALLRAQVSLPPHQGRAPRRRLHGADRQGARGAARPRCQRDHLRGHGLCRAGSRGNPGQRRHRAGGRRSAHRVAARPRRHPRKPWRRPTA